MLIKLQQPLARPIILTGASPRTLTTLLAALDCLNANDSKTDIDVDATINQIMSAADSGDPDAIEAVTARLEELFRDRGLM